MGDCTISQEKEKPDSFAASLKSSKMLQEFVHYIFMTLLYVKKGRSITGCTDRTLCST